MTTAKACLIRDRDDNITGVTVVVTGMEPATKGSYRVVSAGPRNFHGKTKSRLIPMNKNEYSWRALVAKAIEDLGSIPQVTNEWYVRTFEQYFLLRPKTVKNRLFPNRKPDLDKLERATHDALTDSGLLDDDSFICNVSSSKRYVDTIENAGATITVYWERNK